MENFHGHGTLNHTPGTMWYCFVGKNFVVRFSTTKTMKILPPEKYPLYGINPHIALSTVLLTIHIYIYIYIYIQRYVYIFAAHCMGVSRAAVVL